MRGETVQVRTRVDNGKDDLNNPVYTYEATDVDNVLVAPKQGEDLTDSVRPDGLTVVYTLYFPKTFTGSLELAEVCVRGEWLSVVGAPDRYLSNCPTSWNRVVNVGGSHG